MFSMCVFESYLSNVSYSYHRNHVQNYTLQEQENSDHLLDKITYDL